METMRQLSGTAKRIVLCCLILAVSAVSSGIALGKGGSGGSGGSGGGRHGGGGGRHGGEVFDDHGGRHGGGGSHGRDEGRHGSVVKQLPSGFIDIEHHGRHHFFHDGRFFDRHNDGFIIIGAPIGIVVPVLPSIAVSLTVGGVMFYATDDTYYRQVPDGYLVVESPYRQ